MSAHCLFNKSTKLFEGMARGSGLKHDPATHVSIVLIDIPDRRTVRLNGTDDGITIATGQELADYDAAEADGKALAALQADQFTRFLFELHFDSENRIRALEGKQPITKAAYKNALKTLFKAQ